MSNPLLEMLDDAIEQAEFQIDNDQKCEWALNVIREEQAETQRIINVCNSQILYYQTELRKAQDALERKTGGLKMKLFSYFQRVPHKATKTQETYKLPSGTLKMKFPGPEFKRDDEKLVEWLEQSEEYQSYVKVKKSPDWSELKKIVKVSGNLVYDMDGMIVDGVQVVERDPVFEVDI